MKSTELRPQIRSCLASSLDESAKIVWLYALTVPVGIGVPALARKVGYTCDEVNDAIAILEEAGLIQGKVITDGAVVWSALPFRINVPKVRKTAGKTVDTTLSLSRAALRIFRIYQEKRAVHKAGYWTLTEKSRKDMMTLVQKMDEYPRLEPAAFIDFAIKLYKSMGLFPSPAHLCGAWVWDEWVNASSTAKAASKEKAEKGHAGKDYGDPKWARAALRKLGFKRAATTSDAGIIYVHQRAKEVIDFDVAVAPTDEWKDEIHAMVKLLREEADAEAT